MTIESISDWHKLLNLAKNGNPNAMNEIALGYEFGLKLRDNEVIEVNTESAFYWTKKSFEANDIIGIEKYADYLSDLDFELYEYNQPLAMKLYEKAIEAGSASAAHSLGIEYRNQQHFEKAFDLYNLANQSPSFSAELTIAQCYLWGVGTLKKPLKALEILKLINSKNNTQFEVDEANYLIGKIYLEGQYVTQSLETARYYLELSDKDGDHRSAQELLILIGRKHLLQSSVKNGNI